MHIGCKIKKTLYWQVIASGSVAKAPEDKKPKSSSLKITSKEVWNWFILECDLQG